MNTQTLSECRELVIENENNKLQCDVFMQITLAPPEYPAGINLIGKKFFINFKGDIIYVKLVDYEIHPLPYIESMYTWAACGCNADTWLQRFKEKYPHINSTTKIGVYCYRRIHE